MSVYAVTVMYEDLEQVSRLIRHLFDQTVKVKAVIVVDNSEKGRTSKSELSNLSEDGTIYYYKLSSNIGSSGGFAVGQALALHIHNSIEPCWIWLNDHDGYPERACLETMIEDFKDYPAARIICPIVYDTKNRYREKSIARRRLTCIGTTKRYYSSSGSKSINLACSAGIIIHSLLIEEIGFYDYRHFFANLVLQRNFVSSIAYKVVLYKYLCQSR